MRGGWLAQLSWRSSNARQFHSDLWWWGIWRAGGLRLPGMALLKWGVLTGERTPSFYRNCGAIGVLLLFSAPAWLERFRFGPLEWLWRTLNVWRAEPIRRTS